MRQGRALESKAAWRLWKRLTSKYAAIPVELVDQAMDRETRADAPWRYHVWYPAWLVAFLAYMPVAAAVALFIGQSGTAMTPPIAVLAYGPIAILSTLVFYYGIRDWLCPFSIPWASPAVEPAAQSGSRTRKKAPGSPIIRQKRSSGPAVKRSRSGWWWVGSALLIASAVGRFFTHHS
jgi:hypothetical protein